MVKNSSHSGVNRNDNTWKQACSKFDISCNQQIYIRKGFTEIYIDNIVYQNSSDEILSLTILENR